MNKVFLNALLRAYSPSGYEENATQVVQNYLDGVANFEFIDKVGNAAFSVGSGDVKIMLSGHIDEIALQVQNIDDKGFIHFIIDGGIDPKVLPGSTVAIHIFIYAVTICSSTSSSFTLYMSLMSLTLFGLSSKRIRFRVLQYSFIP